jgi:hypothetical protein
MFGHLKDAVIGGSFLYLRGGKKMRCIKMFGLMNQNIFFF